MEDSLLVARQPNCRKVAPAELPHDDVPPVLERVTDGHGVVSSRSVLLQVLLRGQIKGGAKEGKAEVGNGARQDRPCLNLPASRPANAANERQLALHSDTRRTSSSSVMTLVAD